MIKTNKIAALAALVGIAASAVSAPASALACTGFVTSDAYGAANACYGIVAGDNIETSGAQAYTTKSPWMTGGLFFAGGAWTVHAEQDGALLDASNNWALNTSGWSELIIVIKQANYWGAWYFNPIDDSGEWSTFHWNGNNAANAYSHAFALVRTSVTPDQQIPEPATLSLLGLGLLGVGIARRRRAV